MREWVCINGRLLSPDRAMVSVFDSGFMQGVGLFETMRAYNGRLFRLPAHLGRMRRSAEALGWTRIPHEEELRDNVEQVLAALEEGEARVRLTVTTGSLHVSDDPAAGLTIVANAAVGGAYAPELYSRGATAIECGATQRPGDPLAGHKTTSYFARIATLREAHARSALEALWFTPDGDVAEGSISNIFTVEDEVLQTPPLETPVLPGVTRSVVMEVARELGIPVREQSISREELLESDEIFLTNSLMQLAPIVRIGRHAIGDERPGEITLQLLQAFRARVVEECGGE